MIFFIGNSRPPFEKCITPRAFIRINTVSISGSSNGIVFLDIFVIFILCQVMYMYVIFVFVCFAK